MSLLYGSIISFCVFVLWVVGIFKRAKCMAWYLTMRSCLVSSRFVVIMVIVFWAAFCHDLNLCSTEFCTIDFGFSARIILSLGQLVILQQLLYGFHR